jgi:uncharacterized membrane protein YgaE (UPF0421/DUF939 family)
MKKIKSVFLLNREAYLFDAGLYVMKSLAAVLTTYAIVQRLPLVHKDLISVLFGLMMTLEPVTVTGIRSGFKQITATLLGALVTAVIISVFGINIWTVAVSVSATLIVCLKINWREVSPVAIFTSIYMTNYVQYTANGEPSSLLTLQLRILSLGTGVLMAVLFNFLFSMFFYKQMERKRIIHILMNLAEYLKQIQIGIKENTSNPIDQAKTSIPETMKGIDWLASLLEDKKKEAKLMLNLKLKNNYDRTISYQTVLTALSNATHLIYDTTFILTYHREVLSDADRQLIADRLQELIRECDYLATHYGNDIKKYTGQVKHERLLMSQDNRIISNLSEVEEMLDIMNDTLFPEGSQKRTRRTL